MNGISVLNQYKCISNDILVKLTSKLNNSFKSFFMETLILYMVIPGRINFLQFGRYGKSCEQQFFQNFSKNLDWAEFNLFFADRVLTDNRKAIGIDPSFITKSGEHTPWISYFWSGTTSITQRGLEILRVGLIDIDTKDCISLKSVQTHNSHTLESLDSNLLDWYLSIIY